MKTVKTAGLLTIAAVITLVACKKDSNSNDDADTTATLAASGSASESMYDDVFDVVVQNGENNNLGGRIDGTDTVSTCAVVTVSPSDASTFPKTMTIDFGTGCTDANGVTRKGKITVVLTGRIRTAGTIITTTFTNYYVNNYKLEGTHKVTNNSTANGLSFTRQVSDGKITYPDGTTWFTYNGTHTLTQTAGTGTTTILDDVFSITGTYTVTSSASKSLTVTITTALVKNMTCKNIVSGVEQFKYNNISGTLNFGDGTCDNQATLTVGNSSKAVTLPR